MSTITTQAFGGSLLSRGARPTVGTADRMFQPRVNLDWQALRTINSEDKVISERTIDHEIVIPKRVVREEVIEKVLIVPETIMREEIIEERQRVTETIIEIAKPVYVEKIVEVPQVEYRDKVVEVVHKVLEDKIKAVPKIEYQERLIEVPKHITQEKIVEIPNIEYREVIVEKIVEVPELREQIVVKEVPIPRYVEKIIPVDEVVEVPVEVHRNVPVTVEAVTTFEYELSQYQPRVNKVQYPVYIPRFIEVPVSAELFNSEQVAVMQSSVSKLNGLTSPQALGLQDIETMAVQMRQQDFLNHQVAPDAFQKAITNAWKSGQLQMVAAPQANTVASTASA